VRRSELAVDLVALAMPLVGWGSLVAAVGSGAWFSVWWSVGFVVLALVAFLVVLWPRRRVHAPVADAGVHVLAVNLWYLNRRMADAARDVVASGADVVVVSELGVAAHEVLCGAFEHHEVLTIGGARGHGVYSRLPLERLPDPPQIGPLLHVCVGGAQPFTLLAAHLPRAVLFEEPRDGTASFDEFDRSVRVLCELATASPDTVVAGDLNLSDRQAGYRRLVAGRLDAMRTGRARATFMGSPTWRLLSFRIDHLVVPADWAVADARRVRVAGSDHLAIAARIGPPTPSDA
jgi:endonuclease/exonuclease/phosphatase (EEP) superfamily protein YafD